MTQVASITPDQFKNIETRLTRIEHLVEQIAGKKLMSDKKADVISPEKELEYLKDYVEFLEAEKANPSPSFTSAKDLVDHLAKV